MQIMTSIDTSRDIHIYLALQSYMVSSTHRDREVELTLVCWHQGFILIFLIEKGPYCDWSIPDWDSHSKAVPVKQEMAHVQEQLQAFEDSGRC